MREVLGMTATPIIPALGRLLQKWDRIRISKVILSYVSKFEATLG